MQAPWTQHDEARYRRNRRFALVGKLLTLAGVAGVVAAAQTETLPGLVAGVGVQNAGQLTWAGSDLRGAKQLRSARIAVGKTAGIVGVIGACFLSPLLWVAGPIQSAQIRNAHAGAEATAPGARVRLQGAAITFAF